ncbi:MAG: TonB-dependent receptor [Dysgonamonadaceae bacterium]|jgi:TonB-linked SusC/RagA family outer membrane protein|nr:TonB-dependent receptor [Dysgonamonadaceae bacterium]
MKQTRKFLNWMLIMFSVTVTVNAQDTGINFRKTVKGIVTERETGEPLAGVSIFIRNTAAGTTTGREGDFMIEVNSGEDVLIFSYIGKKTFQTAVRDRTWLTVEMEDNEMQLDEVIVQTGYMIQRKADLTGSVAMATASDITQNPSTNVLKSLQGKLPGVYITTDGSPGSSVGIQIRGLTSLNAQPGPLIVLDGLAGDYNLRDINPANIESIQVLKDASSASIYGSRAAGGVIIIETKKAKKGDLQISYDGRIQLSAWANKPDLLDTDEYARAIWQTYANDNKLNEIAQSIRFFEYEWGYDGSGNPEYRSYKPVEWLNNAKTMKSARTNWADEISRTGVSHNHQISVASGNDKSRTFFNLGYENTEGMQLETFWRKYSMRLNTDFDLVKNRLKIGENFEMNYLNYREGNQTGIAVAMPPNIPVYTENGDWGGASLDVGMDDYRNPVRNLLLYKDNINKFLKLIGNVYADLKIIEGLNLKTSFGVDYRGSYYRFIDPKWKEADGSGRDEKFNYVINEQSHFLEYQWTNQVNYNAVIGKHNIGAVAGMEFTKAESENFYARKDGLILEDRDYGYLSAATGDNIKDATGSGDEYALLSYFGKANYSYDYRYLLSATIRRDGSSKFGADNRWATFPAFSLGWRIKNESFMDDVDFLSDLKLRYSWGMNGNSAIPSGYLQSSYLADYNGTSYAIRGQENGTLQSGYRKNLTGNSSLKWETVTQTNYGVDYGFLGNKIAGSIDYFYKKTTDMLYLPPYIGAFGEGGYQYVNGPSMDNRGIEFLMTYRGNIKSDFSYNITANFATYKNKILDLPDNVRSVYGGNGMLDDIIGRPRNSIYGYIADGIFKTEEEVYNSPQQAGKGIGRIRYKDLDGDGRITQEYDRTWIGVEDPDFTFGLNFQALYKDIDFSMFFQGVYGIQVWDTWIEYSDFWNIQDVNNTNHLRAVFDAWTPQNPGSDKPALSTRNINDEKRSSTYFIKDGSYLKLRTIEIGYTLPEVLIKKTPVSRARAYVSANNLFTVKKFWDEDRFSGPDPENRGFGYAVPFIATFGVNITF